MEQLLIMVISDKDYLRCKKIWNEFSMKNMDDYHDHYSKKDVLLLADIFEKFIDTCLKFNKLDPCHYFSSPGLSWDAMLERVGVKLEKNIWHWHVLIHWKRTKRVEFLTLLKDTVKQITKTWKIMILQNHQNIYCTLMWIICMAGEWVVIFLRVNLSC